MRSVPRMRSAAERVKSPIADTTGQSFRVDDYLGVVGSVDRVRISKALDRLADKVAKADERSSVDVLRDLFGE